MRFASLAPLAALPWLQGFFAPEAVTEQSSRDIVAELATWPEPAGCSASELVGLATGDAAIGTPVIALAATAGGRTENRTWLALYRISAGGAMQPIFVAEVEHHERDTTRTGVVTLIPGGLVYRDPWGAV